MEQINWVTTPPCSKCIAMPELTRRFPCIGCEKLHSHDEAYNAPTKRSLSNSDRQLRNKRIGQLRVKGLSFEQIAIMLKMPRATVQSAAASFFKQKCVDYTISL